MTKTEAIKIITESPELKKAAIAALEEGRILPFLKEQGIEVEEAEVKEFLQSKNGELKLDELNKVAGGIVVPETHC